MALPILVAVLLFPPPITLYVATNGNDAWSGHLSRPNRSRTDGPLATITAARDALRKTPGAPATVRIEAGTYRIAKPIAFGPEDSGTPQAPRRYIGDKATVSGMRLINYQITAGSRLQADVPPGWDFSQLFVNGVRRYRPRLPKKGYYEIADKVAPTDAAKGHGFDRFQFNPGEIDPSWANRDDVEILVMHIWGMSRNRIGSVDGNVVTFKAPTGYDAGWADMPKGSRYLVENVKEALTNPGEWYLDRPTHTLTYIPKPGELADQRLILEAPVAESLLRFEGDSASSKWAHDIDISGVAFEGTNWNLGPLGRNFPQAEADLSGAIVFKAARDCKLDDCSIEHTGTYAVDIQGACKGVDVEHCVMSDLGAGGVKVGEMANAATPDLLTEKCTVKDNSILAGGRLHPAAVGVWVGQNPYVSIDGNTIRDFYYTGISAGWSWGYGQSDAHDNSIVNNRISQIGQGVLSDMGGIYTLSPQPGTIIAGNRIHDVQSFSYGGWGIYPDEGSSSMTIENNCVFRCKSAGFHQHYGKENVIRNNVFAMNTEAQIMRTRAEDHLSLTFENNIVCFDGGVLLGSNWSGNEYKFDHNLYWRVGGKPFDFAGLSLEQWRAKGQDVNSKIADPQFMNAAADDFRLRPSSPAFGLGFKPFEALSPGFERRLNDSYVRAFP